MKAEAFRTALAHDSEPKAPKGFAAANETQTLVIQLVRPPAGLSRTEAAFHVGVSPTLFDDMVAKGQMPWALPLGRRRNIWNVRALDLALDKLAGIERTQDPATDSLVPTSTSDDQWISRLRDDRA